MEGRRKVRHQATGGIERRVDRGKRQLEENFNRQEIADSGIAPSSPNKSAILTTLPSSASGVAYTVVLRGASDSTGFAVVEV